MRRMPRRVWLVILGVCAPVVLAGEPAEQKPVVAPPPLPAPDKDGFIALFNGKDFSGWVNSAGQPAGAAWTVQDGAMVLDKSAKPPAGDPQAAPDKKARPAAGGDIWTQQRFGDFTLDLEFKTEGNSGIFIRTDKPGDCVQTGIEVQVLGPTPTPNKNSCGAIYDCLAPTKEAGKKGEWNRAIIVCKDNLITVEMNGEKIIEMDLNRWTEAGKNPDGVKNKFRKALKDFAREGHIGLQDHGAKVLYRNIRIKPQTRETPPAK